MRERIAMLGIVTIFTLFAAMILVAVVPFPTTLADFIGWLT